MQALSFQVVFVAVDEVGVEVGGREVFAAEVSGEAVFHGVVGFGGAKYLFCGIAVMIFRW